MRTIATVGGLGFSPFAPGTLGSVVGLGIAWILSANPVHQLIGCAVAIALALWSAGPTAKQLGKQDPSAIVIDEVAGMMVGAALLPVSVPAYAAAFLLFRFFDVIKPLGLRRLERLPGSWGIVLDDLAAGLATRLFLLLLGWIALSK